MLSSSPRTAKLNHQKLISKIHFDKVQEILNNQNGGGQYLESPNTLRRQYMQQEPQVFENQNEIKFSPAVLNDHLNFIHQPTPVSQSPIIRKSILKQTNTNYENYNHKSPNSSPLLNTQLTRHDLSNNGRQPLSIPSSPLKVNVNETKWSNFKSNNKFYRY